MSALFSLAGSLVLTLVGFILLRLAWAVMRTDTRIRRHRTGIIYNKRKCRLEPHQWFDYPDIKRWLP